MSNSHMLVQFNPHKERLASHLCSSNFVTEIQRQASKGYRLQTITTDTVGGASLVFERR